MLNIVTETDHMVELLVIKMELSLYGEPWIAKYPKSNEGMAKSDKLSKFSQTPLSEFIGSHIYEILGYPVHKTLLGIRKNNLVVACKDFCDENTRLLEMRTLKNIHISEMNQTFKDNDIFTDWTN